MTYNVQARNYMKDFESISLYWVETFQVERKAALIFYTLLVNDGKVHDKCSTQNLLQPHI